MSQHVVVVGRGLAGAMVAWKFAERGCRISWWGDGEPGASRVAAGMFNLVSFRRVVEVWNASAHVANMRSTLQAMEEAFGLQGALIHDVPVVKIFANDAYRQTWDDRWTTDHAVTQWAERGQPAEALDITSLNAPYGGGQGARRRMGRCARVAGRHGSARGHPPHLGRPRLAGGRWPS